MRELKPMVDWLTYRSYEHNRRSNPQTPYYKWRLLFKDAVQFEEIYENYMKKLGDKNEFPSSNTSN